MVAKTQKRGEVYSMLHLNVIIIGGELKAEKEGSPGFLTIIIRRTVQAPCLMSTTGKVRDMMVTS
jgi:hypothetical protein